VGRLIALVKECDNKTIDFLLAATDRKASLLATRPTAKCWTDDISKKIASEIPAFVSWIEDEYLPPGQ
jgi:hypothetical protein